MSRSGRELPSVLLDLATRWLGSDEVRLDSGEVRLGLGRVGRLLAVDRISLWVVGPGGSCSCVNEWAASGTPEGCAVHHELRVGDCPAVGSALELGCIVRVPGSGGQGVADEEYLRRRGVTAATIVPVLVRSTSVAFLSVESVSGPLDVGHEHTVGLWSLARLLGVLWRLEFAEQRRLELERVVTARYLLSGLLHDLRNIAQGIEVGIQTALATSGDGTDRVEVSRQLLEGIAGGSRTLVGLLERTLDLTRPSAPRRERLQLGKVVSTTVALLRPQVGPGVVFRIRVSPELWVSGDRALLASALVNVIRNAMEAVGEEGEIVVSGRRSGEFVELAVEDSGPGIPEELRARVFAPFVTSKRDGMGLGLMMVQDMVRAMGGAVEVASEPGEGTRVTLRLRAAPAGRGDEDSGAHPVARCLVLYDDDASLRRLLRRQLERSGWLVVETRRLEEVEAAVRDVGADVVLLDWLTGPAAVAPHDVVRRLVAARCPVVILTGAPEAVTVPGVTVLQKPVSVESLDRVLRGLTCGNGDGEVA